MGYGAVLFFGTKKLSEYAPSWVSSFIFLSIPPKIACQTSVSPDDTMARNDDGNGIVPHCAAYRLRGHPFPIAEYGHFLGQLPIGYDFAIGNLAEGFPYRLPEFTSCRLPSFNSDIRGFSPAKYRSSHSLA